MSEPMPIPELVDLIHQKHRQRLIKPTSFGFSEAAIRYSVGFRSYMVTRLLDVYEVADSRVFVSEFSDYQQRLLRG